MKDIKPLNYSLQMKPDLSTFSFSSKATIDLKVEGSVSKIDLNALELAVWKCMVYREKRFVPCKFSIDPEKEILSITLPDKMSGEIILEIEYEGKINDQMVGFYRSMYKEGGDTKFIAVTQFQESDARRAMPCMDHPVKKASFDLEMQVDRNLKVISNEVILREAAADGGKKSVKFRKTPKMSTYLVFMGIGDFEFVRDSEDSRVAVVTLPEASRYGEYGAGFGSKALNYCEKYFQIPYPLPKMDLIAVPDFAFGAMENWGAVTFRENLLLFYPDITSKAGEQRICEVIAHEIVHQWFGNLVTPSDWKFLWLNESFATYFAYRIVDHYHSEWDAWGQFLSGQTDSAMSRDQLRQDQAIEIPGGEHVVINSSTAPIIYSKGGSVLRQVEGYIGQEAFQKGLQIYLKKYAYGNAASEDLWKSFEEASHKPVTAMMQNWVEQPGYPIVEADRKDDVLVLTQRRFTCLPKKSDQTWLIPLQVRIFRENGDSSVVETLMDGKKAHVNLGENAIAYKVNDWQTGFYRTKYLNSEDLLSLGELAKAKKLAPRDRWGLQNDLFALVKAGEVDALEYLSFLKFFILEDAYLPTTSIASNLHHLFIVLTGEKRKSLEAFGAEFSKEALSRMGLEPGAEEPVTTSMLRDQLLWHAVLYGNPEAQEFVEERFKHLHGGGKVHPDIMKAVLQGSAQMEKRSAMDWMKDKFRSSASEHERMNILAGLSCFEEPELIREALKFSMDEVPSRNKFIPIASMGANPNAEPLLWDWFLENLKELEKMHPLHFERVITGVVPVSGLEKAESVKEFLTDYTEKNKRAKDAARLALEKLEINLKMRRT